LRWILLWCAIYLVAIFLLKCSLLLTAWTRSRHLFYISTCNSWKFIEGHCHEVMSTVSQNKFCLS
jgi:hypothetical protein